MNLSKRLQVNQPNSFYPSILESIAEGINIYYKVSNPKVNQACVLMREVLLEQLEEGQKMAKKFSSVK